MRACVLIREQPQYRRDAFASGLRACGWDVTYTPDLSADALVIWNRYGHFDKHALDFERGGRPVLVAENGYLGRDWGGSAWYAISRNHHNGAGWIPDLDRALPASILKPWQEGTEVVVLAQRGIGEEGVRQPTGWDQQAAATAARFGWRVRVRAHPGERGSPVPLEADLRNAWACVTWGSGAAIKALTLGVPVYYGFDKWIGGVAGRRFENAPPYRGSRDALLRRLGNGMWRLDEIERGEPFRHLLPAAVQGESVSGLRGIRQGMRREGFAVDT